jgi:hypothetical protein
VASLRRNLIQITQIFKGEKQRNIKQLSAKISSETKYLYISLSSVAYLRLIYIQSFRSVKTFHESACCGRVASAGEVPHFLNLELLKPRVSYA